MPRVIAFLHPLTALASMSFWPTSRRSAALARARRRHLAPRHARLASWAYAWMIANLVAGVLSTWALRPDLHDAEPMHFGSACAVVPL
jgi:hypothetical protein